MTGKRKEESHESADSYQNNDSATRHRSRLCLLWAFALAASGRDSLMTWVTVWSNDIGDTFAVGRLGARLNKLAK